MSDHELCYAPISYGMAKYGLPDNANQDWYCSCGEWRLPRNPRTGEPHKETAVKHLLKHITKDSDNE